MFTDEIVNENTIHEFYFGIKLNFIKSRVLIIAIVNCITKS